MTYPLEKFRKSTSFMQFRFLIDTWQGEKLFLVFEQLMSLSYDITEYIFKTIV
jgi:hypothetical protein